MWEYLWDTYRLNEVPLVSMSLSTSDDSRTLLLSALDVTHDSVPLGLRDNRTLVDGRVEWVTDLQLLGGVDEALDELVVNA